MDGRTAEEVLTPEGSTPGSVQWSASSALAALADAGLVVCADGEANRAGEKVRVELILGRPNVGSVAYRLVPLDGGEP